MPITTGIAPLTVSFTDTSTGDGLSYLWAFGDGGTSTQSSPSYTYDDPGEYEATLLVQNTNGESQASQTVIVYEPTPMTMTPMTMTPSYGNVYGNAGLFRSRNSCSITKWYKIY